MSRGAEHMTGAWKQTDVIKGARTAPYETYTQPPLQKTISLAPQGLGPVPRCVPQP